MATWEEIVNKLYSEFKHRFFSHDSVPSFINNPKRQRLIILLLLSLILTFLLLPSVSIVQPQYKVGAIANKDIKANRDFLVEERASTELKRLEAAKSSPNIFDYDDATVLQLRSNLIKTFLAAQEVRGKIGFRNDDEGPALRTTIIAKLRTVFYQYLGIQLSDEEISILDELTFSSEVAESIGALIAEVYRNKYITNVAFTPSEYERGLIVKNVRTHEEKELNNIDEILQIQDAQRIFRQKAKLKFSEEKPILKNIVASIAEKILQPNLTYNRQETEQRRQMLVNAVKPIYFEVQKNEMIVREGEKITIADLDKINAFFKQHHQQKASLLFGSTGLFILIFSLSMSLLYIAQKIFPSNDGQQSRNRRLLCLTIIVVLQILLIKAVIFISAAVHQALPMLSNETIVLGVPFAVGTLLTAYLFNRRIALLLSLFICFLIPFIIPSPQLYLPLFAFLGFSIVIYKADHYQRRSIFFRTGILVGLGNGIIIMAMSMLSSQPTLLELLWKLCAGFSGGVLSGIIVAGISPIFENLFDFSTDIRLLELANLNQPIFQRMIMEIPGTYHHSIIVGSMVEAAAEAIGADPIISKVGAYYHDIGKLKKPLYFIENQGKGENRHDKLSPRMSSLIIISHVKDGSDIAATYKLGQKITDIIRQHHGTSLVGYFYDKAKKDKDSSIRSLPESHFRYPGPRPQTKEAGLVLLGDVIEASSRTLVQPTPSRIRNLVRDRIDKVFMDGQLDECDLTLRDLNLIEESFVRILNGVFHHRVNYFDDIKQLYDKNRVKPFYEYPDRKSSEKNSLKPQADSP